MWKEPAGADKECLIACCSSGIQGLNTMWKELDILGCSLFGPPTCKMPTLAPNPIPDFFPCPTCPQASPQPSSHS